MSVLLKNNIYKLPLIEEFGRSDLHFLYAPIAGNMMIVNEEECKQIELAIEKPEERNEAMCEIVDALINGEPASQRDSKVNSVDDFLLLYVLPNYTCNFSCSYCFSAKGRSNQSLKVEHLRATLNYFIDSSRISSKKLAISYLGGGEPTLSWDVVKFGLEYADTLATKHGIELITTLVTNGSRINSEMVELFKRHNVKVRISFEILEDIQNKQRAQYNNVCKGIDALCAVGVDTMVRSMITPDNVALMPRMVEELHNRFPHIRSLLFDPITSKETFSTISITEEFYNTYYTQFFKARELASNYGCDLSCAPLRNLNMVVERFCTGEFCLTPEGTITVCHQISSPNESSYQNYIYAFVDEQNKLQIDDQKFKQLSQTNTIYTNPRCKDCFIKWNCGGGCMMQNSQYPQDILDVICEFTRRFSKTLLLERLADEYRESGELLESYINKY